jgi:hypothetical protein
MPVPPRQRASFRLAIAVGLLRALTLVLGAWSEFIRCLAPRYPRAVGIEIWNEENLSAGFWPGANPVGYTRMYAAGAKGFMNGIGIHPYPVTNGSDGTAPHYDPAVMGQVLNRIRAVRAANHDASTPLWITETGVSTQSILGLAPAATDEQQAAYLSTMVNQIKHDRDGKVAIIDRLIDPPLDRGAAYDALAIGFGLFNSDGTPKPAACAVSREYGGTLHC